MDSQMELRWSSDGNQWIQDGILGGAQTEAKEAKIDSQDWLPRSNPTNPRANPRHKKKTGHNWSVFKIYRELNDYSATTSNEKVPFTFL